MRPADPLAVPPPAQPIGGAGGGAVLPPTVAELARALAEGLARAGAHEMATAPPRAGEGESLVDLKEAARLLGVSRMTVTRLCDTGRLPCVVVARGGRQKLRRVPRAFIDAVASEALAAGGEVDLAEFASAWLARHGGPGIVPAAAAPVLAAAGGGAG